METTVTVPVETFDAYREAYGILVNLTSNEAITVLQYSAGVPLIRHRILTNDPLSTDEKIVIQNFKRLLHEANRDADFYNEKRIKAERKLSDLKDMTLWEVWKWQRRQRKAKISLLY